MVRADGGVEVLDGVRATPLAVFETNVYQTHHARLDRGDTLLVFSDGVTEAMSPAEELYGDARLSALVTGRFVPASSALIDAVFTDVLAYEAGATQADDITLVALRRVEE